MVGFVQNFLFGFLNSLNAGFPAIEGKGLSDG
jgi:hypothetical protein